MIINLFYLLFNLGLLTVNEIEKQNGYEINLKPPLLS